jgi:TRAP-type C4-dicarboxylate transport system permease small subunit
MLDKVLDAVTRALLVAAALLGFALSFVVVFDVVGRVAFNSPLKGTPEMVSTAIVMICFLQAGYAIRSGGMINVDFLLGRFGPITQQLVLLVGDLLGAAFFGLVSWGSFEPAAYAWTSGEYEGEGALRVPAWPARFIVVGGTALAALCYLVRALHRLRALRDPAAASAEPRSSH